MVDINPKLHKILKYHATRALREHRGSDTFDDFYQDAFLAYLYTKDVVGDKLTLGYVNNALLNWKIDRHRKNFGTNKRSCQTVPLEFSIPDTKGEKRSPIDILGMPDFLNEITTKNTIKDVQGRLSGIRLKIFNALINEDKAFDEFCTERNKSKFYLLSEFYGDVNKRKAKDILNEIRCVVLYCMSSENIKDRKDVKEKLEKLNVCIPKFASTKQMLDMLKKVNKGECYGVLYDNKSKFCKNCDNSKSCKKQLHDCWHTEVREKLAETKKKKPKTYQTSNVDGDVPSRFGFGQGSKAAIILRLFFKKEIDVEFTRKEFLAEAREAVDIISTQQLIGNVRKKLDESGYIDLSDPAKYKMLKK